ncbi:hypothetical protein AYI68_g6267 [Smittium mucronatum]|uniref:Uncharacterized protein n=1 Tax=Smittium mucronatum TaxID=133383 RepID=A0A1R0GS29_9FUNG|nr:hypothetical protein AYI68_g6267 [Smittium mucronatum]
MGITAGIAVYHTFHRIEDSDMVWRHSSDPAPFLKESIDNDPHYIKVKSGDMEKYELEYVFSDMNSLLRSFD